MNKLNFICKKNLESAKQRPHTTLRQNAASVLKALLLTREICSSGQASKDTHLDGIPV